MKGRVCASGCAVLVVLLLSVGDADAQQKKDHLGGKASDIVRLHANLAPCSNEVMTEIGPDGVSIGAFTLPPKTVLVITDLVATPNLVPASGITRGGLINQAVTGSTSPYFAVDFSQQAMQAVHLTAGVRWTEAPRGINSCDSVNSIFLDAYGYLAKNK